MIETFIALASCLGLNSIILLFVKRYFEKKDKDAKKVNEKQQEIYDKIDTSLETIRLLSYARVSEEIERLLDKGYATPTERKFLNELYTNYKDHGWNGDMDARLERVYRLRTDKPD